ncbi:MAG: hypothetical protein L3K06_03560 [Thermoplasmata archaeon]|nr:hypothetical protein [Thermoplasmata archaeon]
MVVDFEFKRVKGFQAATVSWKGNWNDKRTQKEFEGLAAHLAKKNVRTGRWVFESNMDKKFLVAIEVKGKFKGSGRVRAHSFPSATVASVQFDPDVVSPRVVYHGISDWLRWRKKEGDIKSAGRYSEVYSANPWRVAKAWATTTIQVVVKK